MSSSLTVADRIVIHLSNYTKYLESYDVPIDISQDGIAAGLRISRAHATIELKKLKENGYVTEKQSHIKKGKTRRKVYFLSPRGEERVAEILKYVEENDIDLSRYQDIRKCKGPDLWNSLDEKFKPIIAMASVFRKPFSRDVLPDISVSLLPVDEKGMVDLPQEIKEYVLSVTDSNRIEDYHNFAADYWLHCDEIKEVLYHLVMAKRYNDAEILLYNHAAELMLSPDDELFETVSNIRDMTPGYSDVVHYVQAEMARRIGRAEYCLILTKMMEASSIPSERFKGYLIEGKLHMDHEEYHLAYRSFIRARGVFDDHMDTNIECCIAESLLKNEDIHEAQEILMRLVSQGFKDYDDEARAYYLLGTIAIKTGDDDEALRMFTISRRAMIKRQSEILTTLSNENFSVGMRSKGIEYALMADECMLNLPAVEPSKARK